MLDELLISYYSNNSIQIFETSYRQPHSFHEVCSIFLHDHRPSDTLKYHQQLIQHFPAIFNLSNEYQETCLHYACLKGQKEAIALLLSSSQASCLPRSRRKLMTSEANNNNENKYNHQQFISTIGDSPIDICIHLKHADCLELIINHVNKIPPFNRRTFVDALSLLMKLYPKLVYNLFQVF